MDKKTEQKPLHKPGRYYTESERHKIIEELLSGELTKTQIWEKYTGEASEHGNLVRWMRQLGYQTGFKTRMHNLAPNLNMMTKKKVQINTIDNEAETFENLQLKKRVAELEKQLKEAELKAIAFSTMVDIAEEMFKIPIRKKLNTKA